MEKLQEMIKKELTEIQNKGINASNLELIAKLADIYKDLGEIKKIEEGGQQMQDYGRYREGRGEYAYRDGGYGYGENYRENYRENYEARRGYREGGYNEGGGYGRRNNRMRENMTRMMDGMEQYEYGRERYAHGGDEGRIMEGLEKLMYAMCMFVESAMDFAETPQEKEIIRKHIQKISRI